MSSRICYLAGDIGGTNSRLQLWEVTSPAALSSPMLDDANRDLEAHEVLLSEKVYASQKYASLTFVIEKFLREYSQEMDTERFQPIACCLAVAGPVRANKATITNVNWVLDGSEMSQQLGIRDVLIINDFVGVGYGLLALTRKDVVPINDVPLAEDAPKGCIGAGTGLGEVYLTAGSMINTGDEAADAARAPTEYNVWASEGGHADFAPRDKLEYGLLEYFKTNERVPRVSVERIVSGMGIPKIYDYFTHLHPEEVSSEVTARLRTEDPGAVIAEFAANGKCNLCLQTIELFVKCYGAEAGNFALKTLPFGGLYISGGIAPKLQQFMLRHNLFWEHFVKKGRMQTLLEKVPVFIVTNQQVGLLGAKVVCRRLLRKQGFLPGRGELASFTEATPRSLPQHFTWPTGDGDDARFETEVTLRPDTKEPEKVVIRRRLHPQEQRRGGDRAAPSTVFRTQSSTNEVKHAAFKYGLVGGLIASVCSVASVLALSYFTNNRRGGATTVNFGNPAR